MKRHLELKHTLEFTSLRDITKNVSIYFEPDPTKTVIEDDKLLLEEYAEFQKIVNECNNSNLEEEK